MIGPLEAALHDLLKSVLVEVVKQVPLPVSPPPVAPTPPEPLNPAKLLRVAEVAELLAVSERTVFSLTRSGQLPHLNIGRSIRYRSGAVWKWLDELEIRD